MIDGARDVASSVNSKATMRFEVVAQPDQSTVALLGVSAYWIERVVDVPVLMNAET